MKTAQQKRIDMRESLKNGTFLVAPGIYDALSAKIAQDSGLNCLAMGGYAISATRLARPDVGLLSLTEMTTALRQIANATDIPLIGDGDTGYGNALNVIRTLQEYEMAGASCVFFEDQVWPKRCGHMAGKQVIAESEHVEKIRAACEARIDPNTLIMARTDARAVNGFEDAMHRAAAYVDAGAELLFIEALRDEKELEEAARRFEGSGARLFANMIEGGKTPILSTGELSEMGYAGVFWSCASLYLISKTLFTGFSTLAREGTMNACLPGMIQFPDFNRFIGLDEYRAAEERYRVRRGE